MKTCPYCFEEIQEAAIKCRHCGEMLDKSAAPSGSPAGSEKKLYRSRDNKMLSGVCAGLAIYSNMDPTIMRLLVALVTLFTGIFPGLIVYIVASFIVPEDPSSNPVHGS